MACKGKKKDNIELHRDEITFQEKRIDAKRFAYDIIKYTTVKFGLPEDCITVREGLENEYGCDDFCLVVSREIIKYQIAGRYKYLAYFDNLFKLNGLASFDAIGKLLQDVMYKEIAGPQPDYLERVEISMSILSDLVLYLYTKDKDLHLKQLVDLWYDCHLNIHKKSFEDAGGLTELYNRSKKPKFNGFDLFHDLFIKYNCLPYKDTASNPRIRDMYRQLYRSRLLKEAETKCSKVVKKKLNNGGEDVVPQSKRYGCNLTLGIKEEAPSKPEETSETDSDDASWVKLPDNARIEKPNHHEKYGIEGALGAIIPLSQNFPEASYEKLQDGGLFVKGKMQLKKAGLSTNCDKDLGILEHHELYALGGPSVAIVPPSQNISEANPEVQPRNSRPSAGEKMKRKEDFIPPSLEESLEKLSLDSSKPKSN